MRTSALVWEKALRHEWPVTLAPASPRTATRPGRALIGFCDWIETDFSAGHLRRLLQSGDLGHRRRRRGLHGGASGADSCARRGRLGPRDLRAVARRCSRRATRRAPTIRTYRTTSARLRVTKAELTAKVSTLGRRARSRRFPREADTVTFRYRTIVDAALEFLERSTARSSQLDHRAAAALVDYVSELRALGSFACSLARRCGSFASGSSRCRWRRSGRARASLCVPASAGWLRRAPASLCRRTRRRPRVSDGVRRSRAARRRARRDLAGASAVDRPNRRSCVCTLARLAAWTGALPETFERRVAEPGAPARITFSYSCRDTREFRETYASWLMLQAFRLQQGDATLVTIRT